MSHPGPSHAESPVAENTGGVLNKVHQCCEDSCSIQPGCEGAGMRSRPALAISQSLRALSAGQKQQPKPTPTHADKSAPSTVTGQHNIMSFFRRQ